MAERLSIRWSPKVRPDKIRRLYESEAVGRLDEALLDDVLIGLYLRCTSIARVTEAVDGRVTCPQCEHITWIPPCLNISHHLLNIYSDH